MYYYIKPLPEEEKEIKLEPVSYVKIVVVVDNNLGDPRLKTAWGVSIYVETNSNRILFDTGPNPSILSHNLKVLNINTSRIDCIILSHEHGDHTGGLKALTNLKNATVYIPSGAYSGLINHVKNLGFKPILVNKSTVVFKGVAIIGPLYGPPYEQALVVYVKNKGLIVITGCAHPGIDKIVEYAHKVTGLPVYAVIGGFHLIGASTGRLEKIVSTFKVLKVVEVYPIHCTGDVAREYFEKNLGEAYKGGHVGTIIVLKG
ncbi:MAG TPA: MBL fold metallo-hydrolase [Thermoproteales archaeon]|nr:MBL fold metallo-hydrolase [Thermoproteales archaeon]